MKKQWIGFLYGVATTIIVLLAGVMICRFFHFHPFDHSLSTAVSDKVGVLESYIDRYYLEDASSEDLEEGALKGMVAALGDKYSGYFTEEEYESVLSGITGSYIGIGVTVTKEENGDIRAYAVTEGSSADKAGVKKDDIIQSVDGKSVKGMDLTEMTALVKGEDGTKVTLGILRGEKNVQIEVVRNKIKNVSITNQILEGEIGYIKIADFDDESPKQFKTAIDKLDQAGQKGMIIDLRDNGGGSLTAVVDMLDMMLPKGTLLTVKEKNKEDEVYKSTDKSHFDKSCVILINGSSASASEVFAGAMQDRKAATLVGEKSFGKGIVQSIFSLKKVLGGGAIKLTTAKYYLPSGRCIHQVGLTPDKEVKYTGDTKSYKQSKDNQLQEAVNIVKRMMEK